MRSAIGSLEPVVPKNSTARRASASFHRLRMRFPELLARGTKVASPAATIFRGQMSSFSVCSRWCHLITGQAGALDGLLDQSRGFGFFDEFTDVGEACSLTLWNYHADEVGTVVLVQHAGAGKLCRILQQHAPDRGKRVRLSGTQELKRRTRSRGVDELGVLE